MPRMSRLMYLGLIPASLACGCSGRESAARGDLRTSEPSSEIPRLVTRPRVASSGRAVPLKFACSDANDFPQDSTVAVFRSLGRAKVTIPTSLRRTAGATGWAKRILGRREIWRQNQAESITLVISARHLALTVEPAGARLIEEPTCTVEILGRNYPVSQYRIIRSHREKGDTTYAAQATIELKPSGRRYLMISASSPR